MGLGILIAKLLPHFSTWACIFPPVDTLYHCQVTLERSSCRIPGAGCPQVSIPRPGILAHPLAFGVVGDLIAANLAQAEITRFGVCEAEPAHARSGPHGILLGNLHAGVGLDCEQAPERTLRSFPHAASHDKILGLRMMHDDAVGALLRLQVEALGEPHADILLGL